jgi:hypothetical protein
MEATNSNYISQGLHQELMNRTSVDQPSMVNTNQFVNVQTAGECFDWNVSPAKTEAASGHQ